MNHQGQQQEKNATYTRFPTSGHGTLQVCSLQRSYSFTAFTHPGLDLVRDEGKQCTRLAVHICTHRRVFEARAHRAHCISQTLSKTEKKAVSSLVVLHRRHGRTPQPALVRHDQKVGADAWTSAGERCQVVSQRRQRGELSTVMLCLRTSDQQGHSSYDARTHELPFLRLGHSHCLRRNTLPLNYSSSSLSTSSSTSHRSSVAHLQSARAHTRRRHTEPHIVSGRRSSGPIGTWSPAGSLDTSGTSRCSSTGRCSCTAR